MRQCHLKPSYYRHFPACLPTSLLIYLSPSLPPDPPIITFTFPSTDNILSYCSTHLLTYLTFSPAFQSTSQLLSFVTELLLTSILTSLPTYLPVSSRPHTAASSSILHPIPLYSFMHFLVHRRFQIPTHINAPILFTSLPFPFSVFSPSLLTYLVSSSFKSLPIASH